MASCQPWSSPILPYFKFSKNPYFKPCIKNPFQTPKKFILNHQNFISNPKNLPSNPPKSLISHLLKPYFRTPKIPTSNPHTTLFQLRKTLFHMLNSYFRPRKNLFPVPHKTLFQSPQKFIVRPQNKLEIWSQDWIACFLWTWKLEEIRNAKNKK